MNTQNPLLDAQGRQIFHVGGEKAWRIHDAGDYFVSMEWVDGAPAMIIVSKRRPDFAFAICLSSIGKYATPEGRPNPEGVGELALALPDFGRALERTELHHLVDIVMRYTSELILMPPVPIEVLRADRPAQKLWEVTEKDAHTGQTISEATI